MNDAPTSAAPSLPGTSIHKITWTALILITLYVCYFSHLGALGLIGPDEPRYAWIARDMAESGDWVTPRLYGKPWFEKPALYYWGAALSFKLFGVNETTARLPSAIAALLATLALAWLALRLAGWELARWLLLLLPGSIGMIGFSHAAAPDMPFAAMLTLAMVCAAVALDLVPIAALNEHASTLAQIENPTPSVFEVLNETAETLRPDATTANTAPAPRSNAIRYASLFLFGFFLGAAVLAKGPAAVILAAGAMILWVAATGRWRGVLRLFHPVAIGAFLLSSLPWYILCARRNPDFFHVFIIEHNINRYLTAEFQHLQPFWYYLPITIVALLPWVCWLAWFAFSESRAPLNELQRAQILFMAAWGFFPLLFFSLSKSKLPGYILPAIPPLLFLISLAAVRAMKSRRDFARYAVGSAGLLWLVSGAWVYFSKTGLAGSLVFLYLLVAVLGGVAIISLAVLRHVRAGLLSSVIVLLVLLTFIYVAVGRLDPQLSARASAAQIGTQRAAMTYSFKLQRAWQYQLDFYLHREIPEWSPAVSGAALLVTNQKNLAELKNQAEIIDVIPSVSPNALILEVRTRALTSDIAGGRQVR
ncbi:MAG TPA: glycosyltransferase family 39 protein [Candidatus Acidoferrum sp.]|jgi:4-amino-4-deoxy-L-arabinose transferase-like glycosyltransferase